MRVSSRSPLFWAGAIAVLTVLALVAVAAVTAATTRERTLANETANLQQVSLSLAEHAHRMLFGADLLVSSVEDQMAAQGVHTPQAFRAFGGTRDMHRTLHDAVILTADVDAISLVDAEGRLINSSRTFPVPNLVLSDRDYYTLLRDQPATALLISAPVKNRVTGQDSIFLARRVSAADGSFLGLITASITVSRLTRLFGAVLHGQGDSLSLVRRDGTLLMREPAVEGLSVTPAELARFTQETLARGEEGTLRSPATGPGGTPEIVALQAVRGYPLAVQATVPESVVLAQWRQLARLIALFTLGGAALVLALGLTLLRQWRLQLQVLETTRLRQLNDELRATVADRERAERALQRAYGENRAVTEAVNDNLFMVDRAGRLVWWNRHVEACTGLSAQELRGLSATELVDARDRAAMAQAVARVFSDGQGIVEARLLTVAGPVDYQFNGVRVLDDQGRPLGVASSGRDISERKRNEEALRRLNEELEERVAQRTTQLLAAKDEAERANQAKSDFLSRMSHELRTPMNAVLGFAQLLEMDGAHPLSDEQREYARHIRRAGDHLLTLINDVLDLAQVEAGRLSVRLEPVLLAGVIDDSLELLGDRANARGISIAVHPGDGSARVLADRLRLKQVILNLLSNAVKYNSEQGAVTLAWSSDGGPLRLNITDTGAGLTADQLARLFMPFERLDAHMIAVEGTGIGLALSKHLMRLMGGEIGVDSRPGAGSTFWITLPLAPAAESPSPVPGEPGAVPLPAPGASPGRPRQVLCIEDNAANMALVGEALARHAGLQLIAAADAGSGLALARAQRPDLILLDINLPGMDGWTVMNLLQTDESTRGIPVVAITANAMPRDIERGRLAGFATYLTKPLDIAHFDRLLEQVLSAAARTSPSVADAAAATPSSLQPGD